MRRSLSAIEEWLRVLTMSERETMQEMMERERAEAIRSMERANRAMSRIFNLEEKEGEDNE